MIGYLNIFQLPRLGVQVSGLLWPTRAAADRAADACVWGGACFSSVCCRSGSRRAQLHSRFNEEVSMTQSVGRNTIAGEQLRSYVERIEHLEGEKKAIADDIKEIYQEAKGNGFVAAGIRYIVKERKKKPSERDEDNSIRDLYLNAMGMASDAPLFRAIGLINVDVAMRTSVTEALKNFVPQRGSIVIDVPGAPKLRLTRDDEGNVAVTEVQETARNPADEPPPRKSERPKLDVPDCTPDEAEALGREAFRKDLRIVDNPFPAGDARRPRWDKGWRHESGGDGMGPE